MDQGDSGLTRQPPYMARWRGGAKGIRGGASPYGPKASLKNWTAAEKAELLAGIQRIAERICAEAGIATAQIFGSNRGKVRDACRVRVIREVTHELNVAPGVVARAFACHRQTVMQALRGKRRPNASGETRQQPSATPPTTQSL